MNRAGFPAAVIAFMVEDVAGTLHRRAGHPSSWDCGQWHHHRHEAEVVLGLPVRDDGTRSILVTDWPITVSAEDGYAGLLCGRCDGTIDGVTADKPTSLRDLEPAVARHVADCPAVAAVLTRYRTETP